MEARIKQIGLGGKPWRERAEIHLIKERILDPETGNEVIIYKKTIAPHELGKLMGISPQKASSILSNFKEDPNYEKVRLPGGRCEYELVG